MKPMYYAALIASLAAYALPVQAAPIQVDDQVMIERVALRGPVNLLTPPRAVAGRSGVTASVPTTSPRVLCDPAEAQKICDLRTAAAIRAWEVVRDENAADAKAQKVEAPRTAMAGSLPIALLVPTGLIPVRAIACDPALSKEECAKLDKSLPSTPSGRLPLTTSPPPVVPPKTPPDLGKIPPTAPQSAIDPVPVGPPSVIAPPPTGDEELVKKPPKSGSQMPVIKPKAAPPVNPQP